jgi:hypothetical protein
VEGGGTAYELAGRTFPIGFGWELIKEVFVSWLQNHKQLILGGRMKRRILAFVFIIVLASSLAVPAFADTTTGSIVLTGGSLSIASQPITFTGFTLDGQAHNNVPGTTTNWVAKDPTGTGAGWHVTVSATDFITGTRTIANTGFKMQLLDGAISVVDGNTAPTSSLTDFTAFAGESEQVLLAAAADTGMGTYNLLPTFTLDVPAQTYAGAYESTVTLTILSTPA